MLLTKKGSDTCSAAAELSHGRSPSKKISQNQFLRNWSHFLIKPFSEKMEFLKFHLLRIFQKKIYSSLLNFFSDFWQGWSQIFRWQCRMVVTPHAVIPKATSKRRKSFDDGDSETPPKTNKTGWVCNSCGRLAFKSNTINKKIQQQLQQPRQHKYTGTKVLYSRQSHRACGHGYV